LESELFGHERGSFTGATGKHIGHAERAGKGTLFLDEIGELRLALQAKLLRLLDERRFTRVGGDRPIEFNARVVAATNADLMHRVGEGAFREDLFFRLNVVSLTIPSLRERKDDIVPLMERFIGEYCREFGISTRRVDPTVADAALRYAWPGNVRELRNRVERGVVMSLGPVLGVADLFPEGASKATSDPGDRRLSTAREAAEREEISGALTASGGRVIAAARQLGISRTTLWKKMRRLNLRGPELS
jgi:DNA-binding NtrC family response regulator